MVVYRDLPLAAMVCPAVDARYLSPVEGNLSRVVFGLLEYSEQYFLFTSGFLEWPLFHDMFKSIVSMINIGKVNKNFLNFNKTLTSLLPRQNQIEQMAFQSPKQNKKFKNISAESIKLILYTRYPTSASLIYHTSWTFYKNQSIC